MDVGPSRETPHEISEQNRHYFDDPYCCNRGSDEDSTHVWSVPLICTDHRVSRISGRERVDSLREGNSEVPGDGEGTSLHACLRQDQRVGLGEKHKANECRTARSRVGYLVSRRVTSEGERKGRQAAGSKSSGTLISS